MFKLSKRSLEELKGVHEHLVFAVSEAIKITEVDFMVLDGIRTPQEQRKLVARGVSTTNNSYHLYGLAVDLVAIVNGKLSWEEKYYPKIATAMKTVIKEHSLPIEWGFDKWGWDMPHWQISILNGVDARKVYDARKIG